MRLYPRALCGNLGVMTKARRNSGYGAALAIALLGAGTAWADQPAGPTPLDSPGYWVTPDDYPRMALEDNKQGTVRFSLDVDPTGRPVECHVLQSSGDEELDVTACNLITTRARFTPARDAKGRAVAGRYVNAVKWVLPRKLPAPQPFGVVFTMLVSPDGSVVECKVIRAEGKAALAVANKKGPCDTDKEFEPYLDAAGKPVAKRLTFSSEMKVEAP
jgi:TonB family protein